MTCSPGSPMLGTPVGCEMSFQRSIRHLPHREVLKRRSIGGMKASGQITVVFGEPSKEVHVC